MCCSPTEPGNRSRTFDLGDEILAADEETGEITEGRAVTALIRGQGDKTLITITVEDAEGDVQKIVATDEHPFWLPAKLDWMEAIDLAAGDQLQTSGGARAQVTEVEIERRHAIVYNLTIAIDHTYFVAASGKTATGGVLSHNARSNLCPTPMRLVRIRLSVAMAQLVTSITTRHTIAPAIREILAVGSQ